MVVDELPAPFTFDEAGILQNRKMFGDRGLRDIEALRNLPRGEVAG
jgi:hypothetical protein